MRHRRRRLPGFLVSGKGPDYRRAAGELGCPRGRSSLEVHRLRQRYRELLREEIARTVGAPEEVEEELRALLAALGS